MLKAVIFDFDGTLVDFENTDIESLKLILEKTGAGVNADAFIERAVDHIMRFHDLVDSDEIDPLTLHRYRLSSTLRDFNVPWDDSYVDSYKEFLIERTVPYPGIEEILENLSGSVKLGILTNAYDPVLQMKRIRATGLVDYFNEIQISGEEKYSKPDSRAFKIIADNLRVDPEKCMFIGDSKKYDIEGAHTAGMQAIHIQPSFDKAQHFSAMSIEQVKLILGELIA
ncbi:MAG: HAD-IA family hydrolase [Candidatus Aegiribacteria sp.]|nr:HAD-IA family hydrolase [Candidatus Aegiribacteria sp.]